MSCEERRQLGIILHGPSGVGKDAVVDALRERCGLVRPTSSTSRPKREGEREGEHYHFFESHEAFEQAAAAGEFVERAWVFEGWKGLAWRELERAIAAGEDIVIRTDVQGARTLRERLEGAVSVVLLPESLEALKRQLAERGDLDERHMDERLAEMKAEEEDAPLNDYRVVNRFGRLEETLDELVGIVERERCNRERPALRLRGE